MPIKHLINMGECVKYQFEWAQALDRATHFSETLRSMAASGSGLSAEILRYLRDAERGQTLFEAAGTPLEFWEAYALATPPYRGDLLSELDLQAGTPASPIHSSLIKQLRAVRADLGPLVRQVRDLLDLAPHSDKDIHLQEMALGFLVVTPSSREAAAKWVADPKQSSTQAASRLRMLRGIIKRYQAALRANSPPPSRSLKKNLLRPSPPPRI